MASESLAVSKIPLEGNTETTSEKKIEANRRNAQLSTGPSSAEGKRNSSRNASKHGLLVKDIVITTRDNKEDQEEFDGLLNEMRDFYAPVGIAEELLVREMVVSYWRSARALRCEKGSVTCASATPSQSELSELEISLLTLDPAADVCRSLLQSSRGIKFLLLKAEEIKKAVEATGRSSTELLRWLAPGKDWNRLLASSKETFLAELVKETERLIAEKNQVEKDDAQRREGERDSAAIPPKEVSDRIHRYETSNVRHRYKVEARLEQLQARRRENAKVNS